jgi:glycine hydroxymethyltransferase
LALGTSDADKAALGKLAWAGVMRGTFGGFDLIISRTGYTGERIAYELFVHPDQAPALFQALLDKGVKPCGLAARDSLRTEAGLPLYGHELAGALNMNPADAGFGSYVRLWKPYFIGKAAFIAHEKVRDSEIARFRMEAKRVRPPHQGDAIVTRDGKRIGTVTSCSIDSEGFQLGQALIHEDYSADGTLVALQSARAKEGAAPEPAVILSRFPKAKKA